MIIEIPSFQKTLLNWFARYSRDLPWRRSYLPYHIWISEIMLQQTQMERGTAYFERWIKRFPDIASIAEASEEEILKYWEGLGYYSRARNIHKAAQLLMKKNGGQLPADRTSLLAMPGIGKYTAAAIMSLAFNKDVPLVDANIERLFARLFNIETPIKDKGQQTFIWRNAKEILPPGQARNFNQALMELGALVCRPRNPNCTVCPVHNHCQSLTLGVVDERPVPGKTTDTIRIEMVTGFLQKGGAIFIQKRPPNGVWANLWEFPGGRIEAGETPAEALVREYMEETEMNIGNLSKITTVKHSYTRYRVTLHCYTCFLLNGPQRPVLHEAQEYRWITPLDLHRFAFPAGHRKLIEFMRKKKLL